MVSESYWLVVALGIILNGFSSEIVCEDQGLTLDWVVMEMLENDWEG